MLGLAVGLLAASGVLMEPLHNAQVQYDLTNEPVEGIDPGLVLATTALGAFRGIIVDVVWIRMESLKQQGKFFEIVQLADLACRLAPRFPKVWDFNAWNMAYNVSVHIPDLTERWLWVKQGIELLRDRGIPNNRTEPELYFTLAFIYLHKIGDELDDAHFFYKQELALEMHEILGGSGSREELERLAEASRRGAEVLKDPTVNQFYEQCIAHGFDPLEEDPDSGIPAFFAYLRNPDAIPPEARKFIEAEHNQYALQTIASLARARRLKRVKLEPDKMIELVDRFGPFDWRSPYPHAMYWGTEGLRAAQAYRERVLKRRQRHSLDTHEKTWGDQDAAEFVYGDINYDRAIYMGLQSLVTNGRLVYDSQGRLLPLVGPDYRFADVMIEHFERIVAKYEEEAYIRGTRAAHGYFLKNVIMEFYFREDEERSRKYFQLFRDTYPGRGNMIPYEQFIQNQLAEDLPHLGPSEFRRLVAHMLTRSYFSLGCGQDARAAALYNKAKHDAGQWNRIRRDTPAQRVDFDTIREAVLMDIFSGRSAFPSEVIERLKERLPGPAVRRIEEAIEKTRQQRTLQPFELPEEDKRVKQP